MLNTILYAVKRLTIKSGEKSDKIYIQGDVYGELSLNELDVSYDKIVKEIYAENVHIKDT